MWNGMLTAGKGFVQLIVGLVTSIGLAVFRVIVGIINGAISLINSIPGVDIATISTGRTSGLEREVKQAGTVKEINQTVKNIIIKFWNSYN